MFSINNNALKIPQVAADVNRGNWEDGVFLGEARIVKVLRVLNVLKECVPEFPSPGEGLGMRSPGKSGKNHLKILGKSGRFFLKIPGKSVELKTFTKT